MILTDYICPICGNRWGDSDACPHLTIDMLEWQAAEIERLTAYCDKMAEAYPNGMLPTDIQVIKDANWTFAQQLHEAQAEIERLNTALDEIIEYNANEDITRGWRDSIDLLQYIARSARKKRGAVNE